ncbi:MAG: hypothetical protein KBS81_11050 [Spirochaetales bacterium]|nr:hypothetical protein [Candidatus Physcosoma equi]
MKKALIALLAVAMLIACVSCMPEAAEMKDLTYSEYLEWEGIHDGAMNLYDALRDEMDYEEKSGTLNLSDCSNEIIGNWVLHSLYDFYEPVAELPEDFVSRHGFDGVEVTGTASYTIVDEEAKALRADRTITIEVDMKFGGTFKYYDQDYETKDAPMDYPVKMTIVKFYGLDHSSRLEVTNVVLAGQTMGNAYYETDGKIETITYKGHSYVGPYNMPS